MAVMGEDEAVSTARRLLKLREGEQGRLDRIQQYMCGKHDSVYVPRGAKAEYRWLIERARVNILPLVVTVVAQNMYVDGYRPPARHPPVGTHLRGRICGGDAGQARSGDHTVFAAQDDGTVCGSGE